MKRTILIPLLLLSGCWWGSCSTVREEVRVVKYINHRVQPGESLAALTARYDSEADLLNEINGLELDEDDLLQPYSFVKVPVGVSYRRADARPVGPAVQPDLDAYYDLPAEE